MLTYTEPPASWHSAPDSWRDFITELHSTRSSTAGATTRCTTRHETVESGLSTASAATNGTTASTGGTVTGSGVQVGSGRTTYADTFGSTTENGVSASESYSRVTVPTVTDTSTVDAGSLQVTAASTEETTVFWPSTIDDAGTRVFVTAASLALTRGIVTLTLDTVAITSTDTFTSAASTGTASSTSTTDHEWLALLATVIWPDAFEVAAMRDNDVIVWLPQEPTGGTATQTGLWSQIWESTAAGTVPTTVLPYSHFTTGSTSWQSYQLSTATASTSTRTGTGTDTGTVSTGTILSSLDGGGWNSTEAPESSTLWLGTLTGTREVIEGDVTYTEGTHTRQTTTMDDGLPTTTEMTETWNEISVLLTWNTWDRSFSTVSTFSYPSSTTTAILVPFSTGDPRASGLVSLTIEEWQTVTKEVTYTAWDFRTNAVLFGVFTSAGNTVSLSPDWGRTDYTEAAMIPRAEPESLHGFTREARLWTPCRPAGFLGFGGGFGSGATVYAGWTTNVISGSGEPGFSLDIWGVPAVIDRPDASFFATDACWLDGAEGWSDLSLSFLGTTTGSRTSALLGHTWLSGTSRMTAIYALGLTGEFPDGLEFFSEQRPATGANDGSGVGRPGEFAAILATHGGGQPAVVAATFPAGGLSWTYAGGDSGSASTASGELLVTLSDAAALSFEEAWRLFWSEGTNLQLATASRWNLP